MRKILLFLIPVAIGCTTQPKEYTAEEQARIDEIADSIKKESLQRVNDEVFGDTVGVYTSPIKVLEYSIVKSDGGRYRNVEIRFKNASTKKINGIKFRWKGVNAFDEPADLGNSFADGYGGGFTDREIQANEINTLQWETLSRDAKKLTAAWPVEVVYDDGTKWKLEE